MATIEEQVESLYERMVFVQNLGGSMIGAIFISHAIG